MKTSVLILITLLVILIIILFTHQEENFEIEQNTIMGGYNSGPADLELEGPGNTAWSGY